MLHVVHHRVTPSIKFVGTIYTQPNRTMSFITYHFRSTERARSRPVPLFEKRKLSSTFQTGEQLVMGSNVVYSHCRVATGHEMVREFYFESENSHLKKNQRKLCTCISKVICFHIRLSFRRLLSNTQTHKV